jgi:hypothetical protein
MARDLHDPHRSRRIVVESICGAILVIGGVLLGRVGGIADYVGLLFVFLGCWALVHAILVGSAASSFRPAATPSVKSRWCCSVGLRGARCTSR